MGWNAEHVVWQNKDKTWGIGFFTSHFYGDIDAGDDPEWDVEYDYDSFSFASTGHSTQEAAHRSYGGANPGGPNEVLLYSKQTAERIAEFERMAQWFMHPELREDARKKEEAKRKRDHAKALREKFAENNDFVGIYVKVVVKQDDQPWTTYGTSVSATAVAQKKGEWLMVGSLKVKNLKTNRLNRQLHSIQPTLRNSFHGRY